MRKNLFQAQFIFQFLHRLDENLTEVQTSIIKTENKFVTTIENDQNCLQETSQQ